MKRYTVAEVPNPIMLSAFEVRQGDECVCQCVSEKRALEIRNLFNGYEAMKALAQQDLQRSQDLTGGFNDDDRERDPTTCSNRSEKE